MSASAKHQPRFEEQVSIRIKCCKEAMKLVGNLSLTSLAYQCPKCYRRVAVQQGWYEDKMTPELLDAMDSEE